MKLKLPIISGSLPGSKALSMDDYFKFVKLNLEYTFHYKNYEKLKREQAVSAAFSLKY